MKPTVKQKKEASVFTERELKVVKMVCDEKLNREIAEALDLSLRAIEKVKKRVYEKTGASSSVGLFKWAVKNKLYKLRL